MSTRCAMCNLREDLQIGFDSAPVEGMNVRWQQCPDPIAEGRPLTGQDLLQVRADRADCLPSPDWEKPGSSWCSALSQGPGEAKAIAAAPAGLGTVAPASGTAERGVAAPATAPFHAARPRRGTCRIRRRPRRHPGHGQHDRLVLVAAHAPDRSRPCWWLIVERHGKLRVQEEPTRGFGNGLESTPEKRFGSAAVRSIPSAFAEGFRVT